MSLSSENTTVLPDEKAGTSTETQYSGPYTMTNKILEERYKTENKGRRITQLYAVITASLGALSFGTVLGWSSPIIRDFGLLNLHKESENLVRTYSRITSLVALGSAIGIPLWSYTSVKFGPRRVLLLQTPVNIIVWLSLIFVDTKDWYPTCRFFCGFFSISYMVAGESLLVDSVHAAYLVHLIVVFRAAVHLGILLTYIAGSYVTPWTLSAICTSIPIITAITLWFMPESPVALFPNSELKAMQALSWYRGKANIYTEMKYIKKDCEMRRLNSQNKNMLFAKVVFKALVIVIVLTFFQVASGHIVFIFYNLLIFRDFNSILNPYDDSIIFGCMLFVSNFICAFIRFLIPMGVRIQLIMSSVLVTFMLGIISFSVYLFESNLISGEDYIPLCLVSLFLISYEIGLGTYPFIILHDYIPMQVSNQAKTIASVTKWVFIFILTKYFLIIAHMAQYHTYFAILTAISLIGTVFIIAFVVESKDKSLMQIQIALGGNPVGSRAAYRFKYADNQEIIT